MRGVPIMVASLVQCLSLRTGLRRACSTAWLPCIAFTDSAKAPTTCDNHIQQSLQDTQCAGHGMEESHRVGGVGGIEDAGSVHSEARPVPYLLILMTQLIPGGVPQPSYQLRCHMKRFSVEVWGRPQLSPDVSDDTMHKRCYKHTTMLPCGLHSCSSSCHGSTSVFIKSFVFFLSPHWQTAASGCGHCWPPN